ncbi:MAG: hypothetical protein LBE25_08325 [Arthrobacter sp.]|nr:hypothetical protein [Arthrobacter sp.]
MENRDLTIGARVLARGLHAGSTDEQGRGLGEALAALAARVAARHGERHPAVAVAWLHLSLEQVTEAELAGSFGEEISSAVAALTPRAGEAHAALAARASSHRLARLVWEELGAEAELLRPAC